MLYAIPPLLAPSLEVSQEQYSAYLANYVLYRKTVMQLKAEIKGQLKVRDDQRKQAKASAKPTAEKSEAQIKSAEKARRARKRAARNRKAERRFEKRLDLAKIRLTKIASVAKAAEAVGLKKSAVVDSILPVKGKVSLPTEDVVGKKESESRAKSRRAEKTAKPAPTPVVSYIRLSTNGDTQMVKKTLPKEGRLLNASRWERRQVYKANLRDGLGGHVADSGEIQMFRRDAPAAVAAGEDLAKGLSKELKERRREKRILKRRRLAEKRQVEAQAKADAAAVKAAAGRAPSRRAEQPVTASQPAPPPTLGEQLLGSYASRSHNMRRYGVAHPTASDRLLGEMVFGRPSRGGTRSDWDTVTSGYGGGSTYDGSQHE